LNRYSVDLDFWFVKKIPKKGFFETGLKTFEKDYEIIDAQMKHYTILFELRSARYPKRLKIEVRREPKECDYQQKIAFSRFSTRQVMLKAHTLDQTMKNKIEAFLDRGEIRDCFDIEFMLRRGIEIPLKDEGQSIAFQKRFPVLKTETSKSSSAQSLKTIFGSIMQHTNSTFSKKYWPRFFFRFRQLSGEILEKEGCLAENAGCRN